VRSIVLDVATRGLSPRAEALLYAADRAQHVDELVRPALARGAIVLTDRYADSSVAYQGVGRGLDPAAVASLSAFATGDLRPDLTVLLDLPPAVGLARSQHPPDRLEGEPIAFHARVGAAFRALAARAPDRYAVVDGARAVDEVAAEVAARVAPLLARVA
jgi:dTMP kinase